MLPKGAAIDVFVSYSHRDEELREELEAHLTTLKRQGLVNTWNDRDISAGTSWREEIDRNLTSAHVVLLLVSPAFLRSEYCWDQEMTRALERHRAGEARVIPIILRPCDWHPSPIGELQALPRDGKPVTIWPNRDEGFLDVVRGIRVVIEELHKATAKPTIRERRPGEEWVNEKDGSVLVYVPGGEYVLGAEDLDDASKPVHRVNLSPFWIGKFAMTNERYGRFLKAEPKRQKPLYWDDGRFNDPRQPVVGVSWMDAMAYCKWAGLLLPTEAQWEAAARGSDQRPYSWGKEEPTARHAKFGEDWEKGKPTPIGSFPLGAGPFGTLDQAGNVWEWCRDQFHKAAYRKRDGKTDPFEPGGDSDEAIWRVVRGGSWSSPSWDLRTAMRGRSGAGSQDRYVGFRVVAGVGPEHGD